MSALSDLSSDEGDGISQQEGSDNRFNLFVSGYMRTKQTEYNLSYKIPNNINKIITTFACNKYLFGTRGWKFIPQAYIEKNKKYSRNIYYQNIIINENELHPFYNKCLEELRFEDQYQKLAVDPFYRNNLNMNESETIIPPVTINEREDSLHCANCKVLRHQLNEYKKQTEQKISDLNNKLIIERRKYDAMIKRNQMANKELVDKITNLENQLKQHNNRQSINLDPVESIIYNERIVTIKIDGDNHNKSSKHTDFKSMNILRKELISGCDQLNFIHPSKIQSEAIPRCVSKKEPKYPNLIGQAHHGSGKTAAFALIMLQRINENILDLQGLVIVHSRELSIQIYNVFKSLGQYINGLNIALAIKNRIAPNPWNCQICIGTPGTLKNKYMNPLIMKPFNLFMRNFKILVIDEADEFLKHSSSSNNDSNILRRRGRRNGPNFCALYDQIMEIITNINKYTINGSVQTLLFSATYPLRIKKLSTSIAPNAIVIKVAKQQIQLENIKIFKILCDEDEKFDILLKIISLSNIGQMIIFVNTIINAKNLVNDLEKEDIGIACSVLFGAGMDIKIRDKTMEQFRNGQTQCLVASNVIARGIDVPAVGLVVNMEIPINDDSETLIHRIGRTGRFGTKGVCINLVSNDDKMAKQKLNKIQNEYSLNIHQLKDDNKLIKQSISEWLVQ